MEMCIMKNRFRKQNFSLLEMMVVVAIIIILCMLLMPAINSVKEVAKRSQCLSRVREVS
ncbi:MAG: type II secretion system protein, partial [Lentisphaeria bacterium]|nr:type II secretion system protein [Lentisphaeria bacterium]